MSEKRSLSLIAAAVAMALTEADAQCVPLNLHRAVADLTEFATDVAAKLEADQAADAPSVAELKQEIADLKSLLIAAGVIPEQAPSPAQPTA